MPKRKLQRFAENDLQPNVFQPRLGYPPIGFDLRGAWNKKFFKNDHPIVLELGCGRGEYTIGLARKYPDKNFIGVDIKGARLWRGAKTAIEENMGNVAFLRIPIDQIHFFFDTDEVSEIWITFPDPQPQLSREKKRLTSPNFINKYLPFLKKGSLIHLKTDNQDLFEYSCNAAKELGYRLNVATNDLYRSGLVDDILDVKTTYENIFLGKGMPICYMNFTINK